MDFKTAVIAIADYLSASELEALCACYNDGPYKGGIAKKTLKPLIRQNLPFLDFPLTDKLADVFIYRRSPIKMGLDVLHFAGAYYLMDPASAFVPAQFGSEVEQEIVLDLCAAPGGKTVYYALAHPKSLIIANDISLKRATELARNIERMNLANVVVTSFDPLKLDGSLSGYFDKVLLDAPCSGSGMFAKDSKMLADWSLEKVAACAVKQKQLILKAAELTRPGGELLYSTCSYSRAEDDEIADFLISSVPEMEASSLPLAALTYQTKRGGLLFPFLFPGEGQYVSKFTKKGSALKKSRPSALKAGKLTQYEFESDGEIYGLNVDCPAEIFSLHALKPGVKITDHRVYAKSSFDHSARAFVKLPALRVDDDQAGRFIRGEDLTVTAIQAGKLEVVITYEGLALGYGRIVGRQVKNLLPKGLYATNIRR